MTHVIQTVWMLVDSGASEGYVCGGEKKDCGVQETVVRLSSYKVIRLKVVKSKVKSHNV
jgi:hypothetical protein